MGKTEQELRQQAQTVSLAESRSLIDFRTKGLGCLVLHSQAYLFLCRFTHACQRIAAHSVQGPQHQESAELLIKRRRTTPRSTAIDVLLAPTIAGPGDYVTVRAMQ